MEAGPIPTNRRDPWRGRRIGRTKLGECLAVDGRGRVYRASYVGQAGSGPLRVRLLGKGTGRSRLLRQFALLGARLRQLEHPGIVPWVEVGATRGGQLYWVTEHFEGTPIAAARDARDTRLTTRLELFCRVCDAVAHAHAREVGHGALDSESILVDAAGRPHILDFGLTALLAADAETANAETPAPGAGDSTHPFVADDVRALSTLLKSLCREGAWDPSVMALVNHAADAATVEEMMRDVRDGIAALDAGLPRPTARSNALSTERRRSVWRRRTVNAVALLAVTVVAFALGPLRGGEAGTTARDPDAGLSSAAKAPTSAPLEDAESALRVGRVATVRALLEATPSAQRAWEWSHLSARLDRSLVSVQAHAAPITAVTFGAGSHLVATCALDSTVRLWDTASGELVGSLGPVPGMPRTLAMHPQQDWVAVGCESGVVIVLDRNNTVRGRCEDPARSVSVAALISPPGGEPASHAPAVAFDPTGALLAVGFASGDVVLYEVPSLRRQSRWRLRNLPGRTALAFAPDGMRLAMGTAARGSSVRVWDLVSFEKAMEIEASQNGQTLLACTATTVAWVTVDGRIGTARGGTRVAPVEGGAALRAGALSPDAAVLYTAAADSGRSLIALEATTGRVEGVFRGHRAPIRAAAVSADGGTIATADDAGVLKLWDARTQDVRRHHVPAGAVAGARGLATSADGSWIVTTTSGSAIGIWNVPRDGSETVDVSGAAVSCVDASADASFAVMGQGNGDVAAVDLVTGALLWRQHEHASEVRAVDIAPSGGRIATGGDDGIILVWDVRSHTVVERLHGHQSAVLDVRYAPDGATIASSAADGTVCLWDANSGRLRRVLHGHSGAMPAIAWAPDGRRLAAVKSDGSLALWDMDGDTPATVHVSGVALSAVTFAPDGTRLAAAGVDGLVHVLDARTGRRVLALHGDGGPIRALEFAGDGALVAAGPDGNLQYWDIGRGVAGLEPARSVDM